MTEVAGLDQAIGYAEHLAAQAGAHGPAGNEGYLAHLAARKVTGEGLTSGRAMQAAFAAAATTAAAHSAQLAQQKTVQEAYDMNPDAGDKTYLTGQPSNDPVPGAAPSQPAPGRPEPDPVEQEIRQAYQRLASRPGDYVALTDIRDAVPTKDRARVDQALERMLDDDAEHVALEPEPFGWRIGPRERQDAIHIGGENRHKLTIQGPAAPARQAAGPAPAPAPPATPRRLHNARGKQFEYDPGTGGTAVIEPDGWRAVVPPSSSTGVAVWLLHANAEIKQGRGGDVTEQDARARLDRLSAGELRELADETGTSVRGTRTKSQMIEAVVAMMISSPRKHRGLRHSR